MSILDALRVQKANQASISEIARLPQNVIVSMAQTGDLPAHVVPIVLNEKARMAEQMANLQAAAQMQQQPPQTVIEKAMQTNARAEMPQGIAAPQLQPNVAVPQMPPNMGAPQMPPSMGAPQMQQKMAPQQMQQGEPKPQMPPAQGVTSLPTPQMFQQQNYRSGGIVAFNGEDGSYVEVEDQFVPDSTGLLTLPEEAPVMPAEKARSLADIIAETQKAMAPYQQPTPERTALLQAMQKPGRDLEQDKWMRLAQAGFDILGGQSPYAFQNIGRASEALRGYGQDVQAARQEQMNRMKMAADIAEQQRGEQRGVAQTGIQRYDAELNRQRMLEAERRKLLAEQMRSRTAAEQIASRERIAEANRKAQLEREEKRGEREPRKSDMEIAAQLAVDEARARGDTTTPDAVLRARGAREYRIAQQQIGAGVSQAKTDTATEIFIATERRRVRESISKEIGDELKDPGSELFNELYTKNAEIEKQNIARAKAKQPLLPKITASEFKQNEIKKRLALYPELFPGGALPTTLPQTPRSAVQPAPAAGQALPMNAQVQYKDPYIDSIVKQYPRQ